MKDVHSNFSVLDSLFELERQNGIDCIRKTIRLNEMLKPFALRIFALTCQYIESILQCNIEFPELFEIALRCDQIVFLAEYRGTNLVEYYRKNCSLKFMDDWNVIEQVLSIIKKAQSAKINFDPHIKNFVIDNDGRVYYVDCTPPWVDEYFKIRLSLSDDAEKKVLTEYFSCLRHDMLGYHFCSDLLKVDQDYEVQIPRFFDILKERGMIESDHHRYLYLLKDIRTKEGARENMGLFLL